MAGTEEATRRLEYTFVRAHPKWAVLGSSIAHALLLIAAARVSFGPDEPVAAVAAAPPTVVWLRDWPRAPLEEPPTAAPPVEEASPAVALVPRLAVPEPTPALPEPPLPEPVPRPQPAAPVTPGPAEAEAEAPVEPAAPSTPGAAEPADERPAVVSLDGVDWDEERRRAIEQVMEAREREQRYHTFSLADVLEEPEAIPEEPGPERSIFEPGGGRGGGGPALLSRGQARTKAGRFMADLCHALTGGASFMGLFSMCAEDTARSDLFAHLKPEYLRRRPEDFVNRRPNLDAEPPSEEADAAVAADTER